MHIAVTGFEVNLGYHTLQKHKIKHYRFSGWSETDGAENSKRT